MFWGFWAAYLVKLAVLGLALWALYALARRLKETKLFARGARHVEVIESTMLSPHAGVHLLRVGRRYLVIGGGHAGFVKLTELNQSDLDRFT